MRAWLRLIRRPLWHPPLRLQGQHETTGTTETTGTAQTGREMVGRLGAQLDSCRLGSAAARRDEGVREGPRA